MQEGKISKLYQDQEYGKIRTNDGVEAHFHKACLWDIKFVELMEGQSVEFETQVTYKGHLAFHIRRLPKNNL